MKLFFTICSIGFWVGASAQFTIDNLNLNQEIKLVGDVRGVVVNVEKYARVMDGNPYLKNYFNLASLTGVDGIVYKDIPVKLDLVEDKVYYLTPTGKMMELATPLSYISLKDSVTLGEIILVRVDYFKKKQDPSIKGWLQLTENGQAVLFKNLVRTLVETVPYGSAVADIRVTDNSTWVIVLDDAAYRVKKLKDVQDLLEAKDPRIKGYKTTQKGFDAQVVELVRTFNRLPN